MTEYFFNEQNQNILTRRLTRGLRPDEPAAYETRSVYDADGQLVRRVFPAGNEIRYKYDESGGRGTQQNLIETRRIAGSLAGGEDLTTTMAYEPLFHRNRSGGTSSIADAYPGS